MTRSDAAAALLAAAVACLLARPALAQNDVDEAAARVLFAEARKLVAAGDYAAACPKFEESFRLDPGIGTSFNLADCWEHTGRTASAWGRFLSVAATARVAGQAEREQVARERAATLEPQLSYLVVTVVSPQDGLAVQRDAIPVGHASWGLPVPVDPGPHVIQAAAPGKKPYTTTVTVAAAGETVKVALQPLQNAPPRPPDPPPAVRVVEVARPAAPSKVPAVAAAGVAVAGLATAAVFGLQMKSANDDAKALCPGDVCTQGEFDQHDRLLNEARSDRRWLYIGTAVGATALVTAALLWWRPALLRW
jgi:hypothetical protein